ncbi:MAG: squalene synthase HpnC [Acidobacteriota bacterium]|nr:squalene synthase HpnC [Acidobacteriota bacterium]
MSTTRIDLASAYDICTSMARDHYENFPVASWLLPKPMRRHIAAIYAFARTADDFADEGNADPNERIRCLDAWGHCLENCLSSGDPAGLAVIDRSLSERVGKSVDHRALFLALAHTIRVCGLPVVLFQDLLSAFRQDVLVHTYQNWGQLLDYCRRSANPVGRLMLRVAGYADPQLERTADCLCTALQLTNFWQDLEKDYAIGRVYVPLDDQAACGAEATDLASGRLTPAWRQTLRLVGGRTRDLFNEGRSTCDQIHGRLAMELRMTWLGGLRVLDRLEQSEFDVFAKRPTLTAGDGLLILWKTLIWRRG